MSQIKSQGVSENKFKMKKIIAFIFFISVSIIDVFAILNNQIEIRYFSKPLLMLSLLLLYFISVKKVNKLYVIGLFFSFLGDVFLLGASKNYFMFGLVSFLLAHIMYIKMTTSFIKKKSIPKTILSIIPFLIYVLGLLFLLKNHLDNMLIPVIIYGIVIATFGVIATINYLNNKSIINFWLFLGALFFITSDSILAINKFYQPQEIYNVLIMLTYIIAQFLICKAIIGKSEVN